ncbi:hypothetical protein H4R19_000477 [Coemansia spiralis]|nr:hypothetical protein H4R19_000477 [Coemansia spiralis]
MSAAIWHGAGLLCLGKLHSYLHHQLEPRPGIRTVRELLQLTVDTHRIRSTPAALALLGRAPMDLSPAEHKTNLQLADVRLAKYTPKIGDTACCSMPDDGPLGLRRGDAARAARGPRRCHSITILSESEPLLMEHGVEFFGRPRTGPKHKQRVPRNVLYTQALARNHMARRVVTAPSAALNPALLRSFVVNGPAQQEESRESERVTTGS